MQNTRTLLCILTIGILTATTQMANAVVYCEKYVGVPAGCVARPGAVLLAAPGVGVNGVGVGARGVGVAPGVGVGARGVGVGVGGPANRGGPVNRAGRR